MAHIRLPDGVPGIRGPMLFSPETTTPLRELAEILLRGPNSLTAPEREMIATYVSSENDCYYCQHSHGAAAAEELGGNYELIDQIKRDFAAAPVSGKLKALLVIAGKVQKGGKNVTTEDVASARQQGATDKEIHDTVLIAAAFSPPGSRASRKSTAKSASASPVAATPRPAGKSQSPPSPLNNLRSYLAKDKDRSVDR